MPEKDRELVTALEDVEDRRRPSQRLLRRAIERLAANSQQRAQEVCQAVESAIPPNQEIDFYHARLLTLLDREQQLIELRAVANHLADPDQKFGKQPAKALCSDLWARIGRGDNTKIPNLLRDCDKQINETREALSKRFDEILDRPGGNGSNSMRTTLDAARRAASAAERAIGQVSDVTLGDIAARCEKERPGCAAAFSLTRFIKLSRDRKVRFDFEGAVVYSMIAGARRAEQRFEGLLVSANWFAAPVDLFARSLFQAAVARLETFIVEVIEDILARRLKEGNRYITKGGLVQAACNAYRGFDLHATPSAAERTVRDVILTFHQTDVINDAAPGPASKPVCTPEQALLPEINYPRTKARQNLRRAATTAVARKIRKELKRDLRKSSSSAGPQGGLKTEPVGGPGTGTKPDRPRDWYLHALAPEPVKPFAELRRLREPNGSLTALASERVESISSCIVKESPYCARTGNLADFTNCIASRCGTQYYQYFIDPQPTNPAFAPEECCETCCDETEEAVTEIFTAPLREDIAATEADIRGMRFTLLTALASLQTPTPKLPSLEEFQQDCHAAVTKFPISPGGVKLTAEQVCVLDRPVLLVDWTSQALRESCKVGYQQFGGSTPSTPEAEERDVKTATNIVEALNKAKVPFKTVFTGYSSVLNAYNCHPSNKKKGLDWDEGHVKDFEKRFGILLSIDKGWKEAKSVEEEVSGCLGGVHNRALRYLRADALCQKTLGKDKCSSDNESVLIAEFTESTKAEAICGELLKNDPKELAEIRRRYSGCSEQLIASCIERKGGKERIRQSVAQDRKVEISFATDAELKLIELRKALLEKLAQIHPSTTCEK